MIADRVFMECHLIDYRVTNPGLSGPFSESLPLYTLSSRCSEACLCRDTNADLADEVWRQFQQDKAISFALERQYWNCGQLEHNKDNLYGAR